MGKGVEDVADNWISSIGTNSTGISRIIYVPRLNRTIEEEKCLLSITALRSFGHTRFTKAAVFSNPSTIESQKTNKAGTLPVTFFPPPLASANPAEIHRTDNTKKTRLDCEKRLYDC